MVVKDTTVGHLKLKVSGLRTLTKVDSSNFGGVPIFAFFSHGIKAYPALFFATHDADI